MMHFVLLDVNSLLLYGKEEVVMCQSTP